MKRISIICLIIILCLTACINPTEEEPTFEEILQSSDTLETEIERIAVIPKIEGFSGMQGGWTDGQYYYQSFLRYNWNDENNNEVIIVKYDLTKEEIVEQSEILKLNHANDITYNPKLDYFVVCHNEPNYKKISYVAQESLIIIGTKTLNYNIYGIDYNATYAVM